MLGNLARNIFGESQGFGGENFLGDDGNFFGDPPSTFLDVESGESEEQLPVLLNFFETFSEFVLFATIFLGEFSNRMGILEP